QTPQLAGATRSVLAFAVLLVPTTLMGATLPLAVRAARRVSTASSDGRAMGVLYGLNSTGAIAGCLLCGFVLIGRLGLAETIAGAAVCNLVAGVAALVLSTRLQPSVAPLAAPAVRLPAHKLARAAFWVFALSGAVSL